MVGPTSKLVEGGAAEAGADQRQPGIPLTPLNSHNIRARGGTMKLGGFQGDDFVGD